MPSLSKASRRGLSLSRLARGVVVALGLWPALAAAQSAPPGIEASAPLVTPPRLSAEERGKWGEALRLSQTPKSGCFTAEYPSIAWREIACATPPSVPLGSPDVSPPGAAGGGNDYVAETQNPISSATGSFTNATGILDENEGGIANNFSLQINVNNVADPPLCSGAKDPTKCHGWQQFVYDNRAAKAYIQYWIIGYGEICPTGWIFVNNGSRPSSCFKNSPISAKIPSISVADLRSIEFTGTATANNGDGVAYIGSNGVAFAINVDSVFGLSTYWTSAEFNIFGNGSASRANFNGGVTITVQTTVQSGTAAAPQCVHTGSTAETNNLNLETCSTFGGQTPGIRFTESNPPGSIWTYTGNPCRGGVCSGWREDDNNNESVRIAATGLSLWQLWNNGEVWQFTGTACANSGCPGWKLISNSPTTFEIAAGGNNIYQLQNNGAVLQYTSGTWTPLDNNPTTLTLAAASGGLFELHKDGEIWQYTGPACHNNACPGWKQLDNNPLAVAIATGFSNLYQLHSDGTVWKYIGPACNSGHCTGWEMLNNDAKTIQIVAGGNNLFQLDSTGKVWQYTGTPCNGGSCTGWKMLDDNPTANMLAADDQNNLYEMETGGLWQYTGTACTGNSCPGWRQLDNDLWTGRIAASNGRLYQTHESQYRPQASHKCFDCR